MEFFLVRASYLSLFSPNAVNTDQKKLHIWTLFPQFNLLQIIAIYNLIQAALTPNLSDQFH